jgi:hypothetical protein
MNKLMKAIDSLWSDVERETQESVKVAISLPNHIEVKIGLAKVEKCIT